MKFVALVVIVPSEYEDIFKKVAKDTGASGATVIQAKGSGIEEKKSFFSLTFEGNHTVLLYVLEENMSRSVLKAIKVFIEKEEKDALAFTMPISSIVGLDKSLISKFEKNIEDEEIL
ncbi:MAG: hypothetical protein M0Q24_00835 [Sulfurimonas sp.]|uniref:P-II family nitrogen regulator n=1 Tax=Sulfurimonas sp. TaxID=2022749 RepID=UPI0025FF9BDF|nr:hypothetical protein [Sulfurimonas sp.]MCK9490605.1 hypothetical protein [Sulfurimonas sp.]